MHHHMILTEMNLHQLTSPTDSVVTIIKVKVKSLVKGKVFSTVAISYETLGRHDSNGANQSLSKLT